MAKQVISLVRAVGHDAEICLPVNFSGKKGCFLPHCLDGIITRKDSEGTVGWPEVLVWCTIAQTLSNVIITQCLKDFAQTVSMRKQLC